MTERPAERTPVRVAVFGNGFARTVMLPCLRWVDGAEVVGLASPNLERLRATAEQFGVPTFASDHRQILEQCQPDLVIVATPPHRHLDQSVDALEAGCHVICEKPTALDAAQSGAMLEAASRHSDRLTLIDHELRRDPKRIAMKRLVDDGAIGRVLRATYAVTSGSRRSPDVGWNWLSDLACGGGALGALGSHAIDSLRAILGDVSSVRGRLFVATPERRDSEGVARPVTADDAAEAWLTFASGVHGSLLVSQVEGARQHRMVIAGERGSLIWNEKEPLILEADGSTNVVDVADELPSSRKLAIPDTEWARCFLRLAREAVHAIATGQLGIDGAATFDDGHRNQCTIDAIRASAASAQPVQL